MVSSFDFWIKFYLKLDLFYVWIIFSERGLVFCIDKDFEAGLGGSGTLGFIRRFVGRY